MSEASRDLASADVRVAASRRIVRTYGDLCDALAMRGRMIRHGVERIGELEREIERLKLELSAARCSVPDGGRDEHRV